jgi:hypothetical protein
VVQLTLRSGALAEAVHFQNPERAKYMEHTWADKSLHWEQQQSLDRTRKEQESRAWWKNFTLVFAMVALTVATATLLARQG